MLIPKSAATEPAATAGRQLTEAILGFVVSQEVYVAAVLGIADLLAAGPRSVTWLAATVGADPDGLYRLLRLLSGHGIFTELPGRRFANSTPSQLLREGRPGSLRPLAVSVDESANPLLGAARRMVQTGEPVIEIVFGAVWEEYLARDPAARTRFNRLAAGGDQAVAEVLAEQPWGGAECVVGSVPAAARWSSGCWRGGRGCAG